jgi:hypothetical protein
MTEQMISVVFAVVTAKSPYSAVYAYILALDGPLSRIGATLNLTTYAVGSACHGQSLKNYTYLSLYTQFGETICGPSSLFAPLPYLGIYAKGYPNGYCYNIAPAGASSNSSTGISSGAIAVIVGILFLAALAALLFLYHASRGAFSFWKPRAGGLSNQTKNRQPQVFTNNPTGMLPPGGTSSPMNSAFKKKALASTSHEYEL